MRVRNTVGRCGPGRPGRAAAVAVHVVAAVALASGCTAADPDPRAYPGTPKGQTLEGVAKAFGLDLPACDLKGVGFSGSSKYPAQDLNLSFRAPRDCVGRFLSAHSVDLARPVHWTPGQGTGTGFDSDTVTRDFGWSFDKAVTYDLFVDFTTSTGSRFSVVADQDRGQAEQTVYMESRHLGGS
ncbi:hypothetical protein ACGFZP_21875 [Kitasatospora sp. NPDC048239]|uniref:hypothetical protein n=1 Tax=Kitasatospora sp. NPDC048239 TaxID=3364046 RepID=UPI00371C3FBA